MKKVEVLLGARSYQIQIGSKMLAHLGTELKKLKIPEKILIITNTTVAPLYGDVVAKTLREAGFALETLALPDGEDFKTLETVSRIYDHAVSFGLDRYGTMLALGGGVIGDMAGFAAATYMRGINFIQVPTTLLAQVDASVGGKVAVNHPRGKNLIGAFYQPKLVFIDIDTISTLESREIRSGMAEVIKYGVIADDQFFSYLEEHTVYDDHFLTEIIEKSCTIKAQVVKNDELDQGQRAILNFGHTIGHGLEAATSYQVYRHGEAVAVGMVGAALIAQEMGLITKEETDRIKKLILRTGLPIRFTGVNWDELWFHIQADKKAQSGNINFILPTAIGSVQIAPVEPSLIRKVVEQELQG
ncbi:3-dehydroquinate synthase [Dehalobacterium formicoaceticum]|uniref:3-dehydroquinate synthase n=1 Tax=Dehalobacterium formicoaceticum TaxID=51515 RepID=A0ABT1Y677_9FIRM|nr:3-dehydroquinate synthase [Dehalobacterium formicoaceticum]MCR6545971.1 3-dehydroquinate synthase [Dehalobacterium formicoaceticum]